MANFNFLNDELPGSKPGPSQPYEFGTKESADKKMSDFDMQAQPPVTAKPGEATGQDDAPQQFMKKRAQAADFAKQQALKSVDTLTAQIQAQPGLSNRHYDPDQLKLELQGLPPSKYADRLYGEVQNLKSAYERSSMGSKLAVDEDTVLSPLEEAVSSYKRLELDNAATSQQIRTGIAGQDVEAAKGRIQQLDQQIAKLEQDTAVAASPRQRGKLDEQLRYFKSQRQQLASKMPPEQPKGVGEAPLDKNVSIDHIATAAGIPRSEYVQSMTEMMRIAQTHGIMMNSPVSPTTFPILYANLIGEIFNPQIRDAMYREIKGPPKKEGKGQEEGGAEAENAKTANETMKKGLPNVNKQIQTNEQRSQQVWQELAHSGNFNGVMDVLGFVVASFLLGPRTASYLFSNMQKNGNLRSELDRLGHETNQLYHQQNSYIQMTQAARNHAAERQYQRDHLTETKRHNQEMESVAGSRYGGLRGKQFVNPETQRTYNALLAGERLWTGHYKTLADMADDPVKLKKAGLTKEQHQKLMSNAFETLKKRRMGIDAFINDHGNEVDTTGQRTGTTMDNELLKQGMD